MKEQIKKFIIETFMSGEGTLEDDEPLFEKGIIDSVGFIQLLTFLEKQFNVKMEMIEITMDKFATINDIVNVVNSKLGN